MNYPGRRGRSTSGQARALVKNAANIIAVDRVRDFLCKLSEHDTNSCRPIGVEIGFGTGHALIDWAHQRPDWILLGIELYEPGIGSLMVRKETQDIDNVWVFRGDAREVFQQFDDDQLSEIRCFFPDPWPKVRHHKRRLINKEFVQLATSKLKAGGLLLLASDWQDYANVMLRVLEAEPKLQNCHGDSYASRAIERPLTPFESKGLVRGHAIRDLRFAKKAANNL